MSDSDTARDGDRTAAPGPSGRAGRDGRGEPGPVGLTIRVFIYLVGVHFIAGFLFLLFYLGAK
ncbi:DUF6126 family protein [Streptomyces sp. M19]